ncbi:hypothetical protein V8F20_001116 [Naviculisporaceae sp. PSN 640]
MDSVYSSSPMDMPPLLGVDGQPAIDLNLNYYDFDTDFLQDQGLDLDMDYLAEESSGSGTGSGSSKTLSDGGSSQLSPEMAVRTAPSTTSPSSSSRSAQTVMPTRHVPVLAPAGPIPIPTPVTQSSSTTLGGLQTVFHSPERLAQGHELARAGLRIASPPTVASATSPAPAPGGMSLKQRMERRGHTKSRRGCFNCKRRRIKCQETRPACGHCIKTGLNCEYPAVPQVVHQPQHQIPIFSLQDMRLFQHFLLQCYPHYPIGSENIWTHEIPCLSEKYEYLMHAILGFSASELLPREPSLIESAMSHRLKAIKAIKRTLNDVSSTSASPPSSCSSSSASNSTSKFTEEGNALMATCFALTFQSVMLDDGMAEYMTFIRGIVIVAYQMYVRGGAASAGKFLFGPHLGEKQNEVLEPFMREIGLIEKDWAEGAVRGIKGLAVLLWPDGDVPSAGPGPGSRTGPGSAPAGFDEDNNVWTTKVKKAGGEQEKEDDLKTEKAYYFLILDMAEKCLVSSWEAYKALTDHYAWWMMLPHDQFERLINPGNQIAVLLASHWIALKQVMARITEVEKKGFAKVPDSWKEGGGNKEKGEEEASKHDMDVGIIRWLKFLNRSVEPGYRRFNKWPEWVEGELDRDLGVFGRGSVKCSG